MFHNAPVTARDNARPSLTPEPLINAVRLGIKPLRDIGDDKEDSDGIKDRICQSSYQGSNDRHADSWMSHDPVFDPVGTLWIFFFSVALHEKIWFTLTLPLKAGVRTRCSSGSHGLCDHASSYVHWWRI